MATGKDSFFGTTEERTKPPVLLRTDTRCTRCEGTGRSEDRHTTARRQDAKTVRLQAGRAGGAAATAATRRQRCVHRLRFPPPACSPSFTSPCSPAAAASAVAALAVSTQQRGLEVGLADAGLRLHVVAGKRHARGEAGIQAVQLLEQAVCPYLRCTRGCRPSAQKAPRRTAAGEGERLPG